MNVSLRAFLTILGKRKCLAPQRNTEDQWVHILINEGCKGKSAVTAFKDNSVFFQVMLHPVLKMHTTPLKESMQTQQQEI